MYVASGREQQLARVQPGLRGGPLVLDSRDGRGYVPTRSRSCPTAGEGTRSEAGADAQRWGRARRRPAAG